MAPVAFVSLILIGLATCGFDQAEVPAMEILLKRTRHEQRRRPAHHRRHRQQCLAFGE